MSGEKVGYEMKLYRKDGSEWVEMGNVQDVNWSGDRDVADVTVRATNGWKAEKPTLAAFQGECTMLYKRADADLIAIRTAWLTNASIELAFADGDIDVAGTEYLRVVAGVASFGRDEPLAEGVTVPVSFRNADAFDPPTYVTVAA